MGKLSTFTKLKALLRDLQEKAEVDSQVSAKDVHMLDCLQKMCAGYFAVFHGGHNWCTYGTDDIRDMEVFYSLPDAKRAFASRIRGEDSRFPCTDRTATMLCCCKLPYQSEYGIDVFTHQFSVGPRGGVVVTLL